MNRNNKRLAVAFTGPSNSGKTTLIIKVSNILQDSGYKVAIVKHDPKDKATFDKEGKDSFKFSQTGADVAVVSPNKTTIFKKQTSDIDSLIDIFNEFDFLLVEGLKTLPLPRICVMRDNIDKRYFEVSDSIATDDSINKKDFLNDMNILDLNNPEQIVQWIKENAKAV
ncbi:MAG: molybdopterin-guanine dinucleotide biosynthesis protein B [Epsilonproteobacteria bacterium]|nr:MAG: molybdopterin-guanine dinucleotide biosynthesis protein B [Campylobacterota bacterium]